MAGRDDQATTASGPKLDLRSVADARLGADGLALRTREFLDAVWAGRARLVTLHHDDQAANTDAQKQINAIQGTRTSFETRMNEAAGSSGFGAASLRKAREAAKEEPTPRETLHLRPEAGVYRVHGPAITDGDGALEDLRSAVRYGSTKMMSGKAGRKAKTAAKFLIQLQEALRRFEDTTSQRLRGEAQARADAMAVATRETAAIIGSADQALGNAIAGLHVSARRPAPLDQWNEASDLSPVLLGWGWPMPADFAPGVSVGEVGIPFVVDVRELTGMWLRFDSATRNEAIGSARSLLLRILAATPPGKANFTFFDPLGLGQSVSPFLALGDHDPKLIDTQAWSSAEHLRARLQEATTHIEMVIQKYLRGHFETIDEFNQEAGEIAEPYRFLFVFDFPNQFDDATFHQLARVMENGPRCGVFTFVFHNREAELPYGLSLGQLPLRLPLLDVHGSFDVIDDARALGQLRFQPEPDPLAEDAVAGQAIIDRVVDGVGRKGRGQDERTVTFDRALHLFTDAAAAGIRPDIPGDLATAKVDDPSTWWAGDAGPAVAAPLGQSGARDVAVLRFDSEIHSGALLVGRPGSGKSTMLHTYIAGLTTLYSPEELELYLIDFKEGVEFKAYAERGLPHARCVAVESEREFGLSVLQAITDEMQQRGAKIRATGGEHTSFGRYREATGDRLTRIVLLFDEFHVLFAENDRLGTTAAQLLETIIRQGRGFGVHVLLGSQSLAGLDALGRHVPQLLPVRLLLPSAESDAQIVMGDKNDAAKFLTRRGEAVLNPAGGSPEANVRFQTAFLDEEERIARLDALRSLADERGYTRRPVVFEGYAASRWDTEPPERALDTLVEQQPWAIRLRLGVPASISGAAEILLRRESGANVLVVAKGGDELPLAITTSVVISSLVQGAPRVEVIDFTSIDEGLDDALDPLLAAGQVRATRRRRAGEMLTELAEEARRRIEADEMRAAPIVLVVHGIHRARELDADGGSFSDPFGSEEAEPDPGRALQQLLREGPEVGIHVVVWADSVSNLARKLPASAQRDCMFRVAGQMSKDDSLAFIDNDVAASSKPHQIVIANDDTGAAQRASAFAIPAPEWTAKAARFIEERN